MNDITDILSKFEYKCNWVFTESKTIDQEIVCGENPVVQSLISGRYYCQEHRTKFVSDKIELRTL